MDNKEFDIDKILEDEFTNLEDENLDEEEMEDDTEEEEVDETAESDEEEEDEDESEDDEEEAQPNEDADEEEEESDEDDSDDEEEEEEKPKKKKSKSDNFKKMRAELKALKAQLNKEQSEDEVDSFKDEFGISEEALKDMLRKQQAEKSGMDPEVYKELQELRKYKEEAKRTAKQSKIDRIVSIGEELGATSKQIERAISKAKEAGIDLIKNPSEETFKIFLTGTSPSIKKTASKKKKIIVPKGKKSSGKKLNKTIDQAADEMADDIMKQFGFK